MTKQQKKIKNVAREVANMDWCKNRQSRSFKEIVRPECVIYHRMIIGADRGRGIKPGA